MVGDIHFGQHVARQSRRGFRGMTNSGINR
jgi:hypothetical protein